MQLGTVRDGITTDYVNRKVVLQAQLGALLEQAGAVLFLDAFYQVYQSHPALQHPTLKPTRKADWNIERLPEGPTCSDCIHWKNHENPRALGKGHCLQKTEMVIDDRGAWAQYVPAYGGDKACPKLHKYPF